MKYYYGLVFLIIILFIIAFFPHVKTCIERFSNYTLENGAEYPVSVTEPLLTQSYPWTGKKTVSNNNVSDVWFRYPIFSLPVYGSDKNDFAYAQITNNIKYTRNPDDGICSRSEFCGALYHDNQERTNYQHPEPPAPVVTPDTVRVGYFATTPNKFLGTQLGPELPVF
jgi:hypothetical protein